MSQENVELVERMLERFHAGDAEAALAFFSDEVVTDLGERADSSVTTGRDALNQAVGGWVGAWEDWHEDIREIRDLGDKVVVLSTQHGRARSTGMELSQQYATLYEIRAGEITSMTLFSGEEEALAAASREEHS
jgi:ketosteroid isomerase-like protein